MSYPVASLTTPTPAPASPMPSADPTLPQNDTPAQRAARSTRTRLENARIDDIFQSGLHEFVSDFITENNRLGAAITQQYLT